MEYDDFKKEVSDFGLHNPDGDEVWRIRVNGKYVKLRSGRSTWATRGHAVSAFRNCFLNSYSAPLDKRVRDAWIQRLMNDGVLQFLNLNV